MVSRERSLIFFYFILWCLKHWGCSYRSVCTFLYAIVRTTVRFSDRAYFDFYSNKVKPRRRVIFLAVQVCISQRSAVAIIYFIKHSYPVGLLFLNFRLLYGSCNILFLSSCKLIICKYILHIDIDGHLTHNAI